MEKTTLAVLARILDNRQFMFDAHAVREPPQGKGRTNEIMKFPGAVKGRRIEINVIVDMGLVGMRTDEELILSLWPDRPAICYSSFREVSDSLQWTVHSQYRWCHLADEPPWCCPKSFGTSGHILS